MRSRVVRQDTQQRTSLESLPAGITGMSKPRPNSGVGAPDVGRKAARLSGRRREGHWRSSAVAGTMGPWSLGRSELDSARKGRWRWGWRRRMYVISVVVASTLLAVGATTALAQENRSTTHAYLEAVYEYRNVVFSNLAAAKGLYQALAVRVASECPGVIAGRTLDSMGSPRVRSAQEFEQIGDLREEVYAALGDALLLPDRDAALALARELRTLRWNAPTLRQRVVAYATALEERFHQRALNPCSDMEAWASSGYRTLSVATQAFLREYRSPTRLVITDGTTPTMRRISSNRLEREAQRYDPSLLFKVRALGYRSTLALGGLAKIDRHWERELGFPVL
jgi:hypothetical protein